jgi:hypothetical protein
VEAVIRAVFEFLFGTPVPIFHRTILAQRVDIILFNDNSKRIFRFTYRFSINTFFSIPVANVVGNESFGILAPVPLCLVAFDDLRSSDEAIVGFAAEIEAIFTFGVRLISPLPTFILVVPEV